MNFEIGKYYKWQAKTGTYYIQPYDEVDSTGSVRCKSIYIAKDIKYRDVISKPKDYVVAHDRYESISELEWNTARETARKLI